MTIEQIEELRSKLQESFDLLVAKVGKIQIGTSTQFPYGWRKAAKGRTVWRILEEIIVQNLEMYYQEFKITEIVASDSEVSVYDFVCKVEGSEFQIYVNIKSAVLDGESNKDDISKGEGLKQFYSTNNDKNFFIGTFFIEFNEDMTIEIDHATVFPIAWISDIYINPSNNGNFQSAKYKDLKDAVKRTNLEFHPLLLAAIEVAKAKKKAKAAQLNLSI